MAVYFIQDEALCLIKIGFAIDPFARLRELQTGSASPLTLLAAVPGTREDEHTLHTRFRQYRAQGEWFRPGPKLLLYLLAMGQHYRMFAEVEGHVATVAPTVLPPAPPRQEGDSAARADAFHALPQGALLRHPTYGVGQLLEVSGERSLRKLKVRFPNFGDRTFMSEKTFMEIVGPQALNVVPAATFQ